MATTLKSALTELQFRHWQMWQYGSVFICFIVYPLLPHKSAKFR